MGSIFYEMVGVGLLGGLVVGSAMYSARGKPNLEQQIERCETLAALPASYNIDLGHYRTGEDYNCKELLEIKLEQK